MTEANPRKIWLRNVLLCFPYLWELNKYNPETPKYGATFNLGQNPDPAVVQAIKTACGLAAQEKFGDKMKNPGFAASLKLPWKDGSHVIRNKPIEGFHVGDFVVVATSKDQPGIVDQNVQPIVDRKQVYAGCIVNATVIAAAYDNKSVGVGLYLQNVQLVKQGKALGGQSAAATEDFQPLQNTGATGTADASAVFGTGDAGGLFGSAVPAAGAAVNPFG